VISAACVTALGRRNGLAALVLLAQPWSVLAQGVACIDVRQVTLTGVQLLDESALQARMQPHLGCLSLPGLDQLLQDVTLAYVDAGYVAARAYLPEQDIGDGELTIEVVEGRVTDIEMTINGAPAVSEAKAAFPGMVGTPLHIRDLEQGLDQINRPPSLEATSELDAGPSTGDSVLVVAGKQDRPVQFTLTGDNKGASATGENTVGLNIGWDNPLGLNDQWTLALKRSGDGRVVLDDGPPLSRSITLSGSVPYGYWTFGLDYAWSDYITLLPGTLSPLESTGNSTSLTLSAKRVIHRDQVSKTTLSFDLKRKDAVNELLGTVIDVNSRILTTAELELSHTRPAFGGNLDLALAWRHGLGAKDRDGTPVEAAGDPWFNLITLSATLTKPVTLGTTKATWVASLRGQSSNDALFGSEQFSIGGFSSVRGTRESLLSSANGAELTNTLYVPLPVDVKPLSGATLIAGLDIGNVAGGGTLSGATLGLRLDGKRFSTDLTYSEILSHPDSLARPEGLFTLSGVLQF
jgi:hemolysin activation/secretion protein